jgi:hypothetical protein
MLPPTSWSQNKPTLKMEVTCFPEASTDFEHSPQLIPEACTLYSALVIPYADNHTDIRCVTVAPSKQKHTAVWRPLFISSEGNKVSVWVFS